MTVRFTKPYRTAAAASRAVAHHTWLDGLGMPVPHLIAHHPQALEFQHLTGRHALPRDLPAVARLLGQTHTAAHRAALHAAHLDHDFDLPGIGTTAAFTSSRTARVRQVMASRSVPGPAFTTDQAVHVIESAADEPAAFYKDSNPRNFLITPTTITALDFDDLTPAPFGYDLAKLLVTTAMTHGPLPPGLTTEALAAYNQTAQYPCNPARLADWMEIHHILTSPYLGRNGYSHSWHTLRPIERTP
ncbi:phosphotransferase [Kitasatospora sp. NPDC057015]|uniref:phosphotransferase n=1 Tax=Kitasatospora sp. NPDC057015 TaxID=3346001 RepID=UPI003636551E